MSGRPRPGSAEYLANVALQGAATAAQKAAKAAGLPECIWVMTAAGLTGNVDTLEQHTVAAVEAYAISFGTELTYETGGYVSTKAELSDLGLAVEVWGVYDRGANNRLAQELKDEEARRQAKKGRK